MTDKEIRILKKGSCPSLSGKSTLTYHLGCSPDRTLYVRVATNTGGGFFSTEWVKFQAIQQALSKPAEGEPITSITLQRLFKGKSVNTPAFLLAVLKHEKVVTPVKGKVRQHGLGNVDGFLARMDQLVTGKKTTAKKKARPSRTRKR